MRFKQYLTNKNTLILWLLILLGAIFFLANDFYSDFWFDEAYSIQMIRHSFSDIWAIAGLDVHPPLYYYMLKVYSLITGNSIFAYRTFSALGLLATMILGATSVRKLFGDKISILFVLLLVITPLSQYLASEIRMYSWAMFFCFATGIYAYQAYFNPKLSNWVLLTIFSICSFYIHYFAGITVIAIYSILLFFSIKNKRKLIKYIAVITVLVTLAFAPWLLNLFSQLKEVNKEYWIEPITGMDILSFFSLSFIMGRYWKVLSITAILFFIFIAFCIYIIYCYKDKEKLRLATLSFSCYLLVLILGLALSYLFRPILNVRYLLCPAGFLFLANAIILSMLPLRKKLNRILLISFLSLLAIVAGFRFYFERLLFKESQDKVEMAISFLDKNMEKGDALLFADIYYFYLGKFSVLYPENKAYYYTNTYKVFLDNFNFTHLDSINRFNKINKEHRKIFLISETNINPTCDTTTLNNELKKYYKVNKKYEIPKIDFYSDIIYFYELVPQDTIQ